MTAVYQTVKLSLWGAALAWFLWSNHQAIASDDVEARSRRIMESLAQEASRGSDFSRETQNITPLVSPLYADPAFFDALQKTVQAEQSETLRNAERSANARIYFGSPVVQFTAAVELHGGSSEYEPAYKCTGVLIEKRIILTAAHCICSGQQSGLPIFYARFSAEKDGIKFGETRKVDQKSFAAMPAKPEHPNSSFFCAIVGEPFETGDLALVRLLDDDAPAFVEIASLASETEIKTRSAGLVVGYGLDEGGHETKERMGARAIIASHDCTGDITVGDVSKSRARRYGCNQGKEMIGSGHGTSNPSQDACRGDSGGPLFAADLPLSESPNQLVMAIVSRHIQDPVEKAARPCGAGTIYIPLTDTYRLWVETTREKLKRL